MNSSDKEQRELQAAECLRAGAAERGLLLALARKLAGNAEDGMDLYQQALLDCHDAIQRKGFTGPNYKFYLLQAIRWGHVERRRAAGKLVPFDTVEPEAPAPAPPADALAALAGEVERELAAHYPPAAVAAFRLHAAGHSYREIAQLMGPGHTYSWLSRKIGKMKTHLRTAFGQAWANLEEE